MLEREKTSMADVATLQPGISELLERCGARPRGKRFDCPECGARQIVAVNEAKQVFFCHHAGCDFRGGIGTLRKRLGIRHEWLPRDEYRRQRKERGQAHEAAARLCYAVHQRRMKLLDSLHDLNRLEALAHDQGPDSERAWQGLALIYTARPKIGRELDRLESGSLADLMKYFSLLSGEAA